MKYIIIFIFSVVLVSCCAKKSREKYTFIFDFDKTIHTQQGFIAPLGRSVIGEEKFIKMLPIVMSEEKEMKKQNISSVDIWHILFRKYNVIPHKKDFDYTVSEMRKSITPELGDVIKSLVSEGHQVLVIGGGVFGCGVIPDVVKEFGIEKGDIYSGYYTNSSKSGIKNAFSGNYRYRNCANPDLETPESSKKSDVIKYLKQEGVIKNRIIHIGDGLNDLEVWKSGEVLNFIGFGLNKVEKDVQENAPVFVTNIKQFKNALKKYK